ncbi:MAG: carboxypeptidase regulatory-like domain-containing protein, partial [Cytophagales bacterium]|nr:carboxypeptidase regulatory-like domain-containing protein [Cytophagales bacterium]
MTKPENRSWQNIDTDVAEGPICFSPDRKVIYFNRNFLDSHGNEGKAGKLVDKLHIMYGLFNDDKITNITPFEYNTYDHSSTQPYITRDGQELFFVVNDPEGNGGFDIFVCKRGYDGKWRKPENLGRTINTSEDELYPYLDQNENLYFASSGHLGLGGLDIFVSHRTAEGWSEPINLGTPFNSHYDDFGVAFHRNLKSGYFCSDRPGGLGSDDIYSFENIFDSPKERKEILEVFMGKLNKDLFLTKKGVEIVGEVKDKSSGAPMEDVWVLLIDQSKHEVRQSVTDESGKYSFKYVTPGNYLMIYEEKQPNATSSFQLLPADTVYAFTTDYVKENHIAKVSVDDKKVGTKNLLLGTLSSAGVSSFVGKDVFLVDPEGKIRNHAIVNNDGYYAFKNLRYVDYYILLKDKAVGVSTTTYLCNVDTSLRVNRSEIKRKDTEYDQLYPANADSVNAVIVGNVDSEISKKVLGGIPIFLATTNLKSVRTTSSNTKGYFVFENLKQRNTIVFNEASHRALISERFVTLDHNLKNHRVTQSQISKFRKLRRKIDKQEKLVINGKITDLSGKADVENKALYILDKTNNIVGRTVSNADGYYIFTNLDYDNSYKVIFESYEPNLTVSNQLSFIDMDLQEFYGKKGSYKYGDLKGLKNEPQEININCKAFYNSNRQPAENITFFLVSESGKIIKRLSTNKDGAFYFYKQQAGNYMIIQESLDTSVTITINSKRKSYSRLKSNIEIAGSKEYQLFNSVYFELGDYSLNEYAKNVLNSFQSYMKTNKIRKVVLNGYGDLTGSADKTLVLTSKRAQACKDFLDFKGIDLKKI